MATVTNTSLASDVYTSNCTTKRGLMQPKIVKRSYSVSPTSLRPRSPLKKVIPTKRHHSLSPSSLREQSLKRPEDALLECSSAPDKINQEDNFLTLEPEKDTSLPPAVITKSMRSLAMKRREFIKIRKNVICQQNILLEAYASMREIESRTGMTDNIPGDVRLVSITGWPAHDLLLLLRKDMTSQLQEEIKDGIATQVLRQLKGLLSSIPDEVRNVITELTVRRNEILQLIRTKHRGDRCNHYTSLDWKLKNAEFDSQTDKLNKIAVKSTDSITSKIKDALELAKLSFLDRETLAKKIERLQNENSILQHRTEEALRKKCENCNEETTVDGKCKTLSDQLTKERSEKESLRDVISAAEGMLRVARTRIGTLERQLKEAKFELETAKRKHKELEQLYRHREISYDSRSKKLMEISKTGEITIETLSNQRDALELRVKELGEQLTQADKTISERESNLQARNVTLQANLVEKEKEKAEVESRVTQFQGRIKELEDQLSVMQGQCARLVEIEKQRCLKYLPAKENEPSDRETEIWKELQMTRTALLKVEEELRQSRADRDDFLNSLSRIAQAEGDKDDKMATELLDKEQKISRLQYIIEEQRENEKFLEQSINVYEKQLAELRLEIKHLKNSDCYFRDTPYQDLKAELIDLQMQVASLSRERTALVTAAASRALMLERHERAAELFAKITRARQELAAHLGGPSRLPTQDDMGLEVSRSLSTLCMNATDTWSALQAERARVLQLESAVLMQTMHLEREDRVRTQLERRSAVLEREILRHQLGTSESSLLHPNFMI